MNNLNAYRNTTLVMCKEKGWDKVPVTTVWLLLTEEIGELASAIRQHQRTFKKVNLKKIKGTDIQMEMGDVFSYLFQIAGMLEIDLDEMWTKHRVKVIQRNYI
jgi:NTP pyrophosphatase (non-canonical NTP hydrolase)